MVGYIFISFDELVRSRHLFFFTIDSYDSSMKLLFDFNKFKKLVFKSNDGYIKKFSFNLYENYLHWT